MLACETSSNKFHLLICSDQSQGQTDQLYLGLPVLFNPSKTGNCQFEAAAYQLCTIGCIVTGDACRAAAVAWIFKNKSKLMEFTATDKKLYVRIAETSEDDDEIWNRNVRNMSKDGTFGDNFDFDGYCGQVQVLVDNSDH